MKLLYIKESEKIGRFKYYFIDRVKCKKSKHKRCWCYFIDTEWPLLHKAYAIELKIKKWSKVDSRLRKALNIIGEHSADTSLKIIYCGDIKHKLIWE